MTAAFAVRLAVRLAAGPESFLGDGYLFYEKIASTLVAGGGFCVSPGIGCALRPPLYPLLMSPFVATGSLYPWLIVLQAAAGAATVWLAYAIGARLFTTRAGLLAAAATAMSPYAVVHDTALQETVFVNLFTALALWALTRSPSPRGLMMLVAGATLGAAVLTTARVALFVPAVLGWLLVHTHASLRQRLVAVAMLALPVAALVGGWVLRNARTVGAPVLTTESGASLFYGNNEWTFSHFPERSIDLSAREAVSHLSAERRAAMAALTGNPVAEDRLAGSWARAYIREHPTAFAQGAVRKVWVVLAAQYSPARGPITQWGYGVLFLLVHALAAMGLWQARGLGAPHGATLAMLAAFLLTTAIFWAHTSHKSVIDAVLFIYAASALAPRAEAGSSPVQPRADRA